MRGKESQMDVINEDDDLLASRMNGSAIQRKDSSSLNLVLQRRQLTNSKTIEPISLQIKNELARRKQLKELRESSVQERIERLDSNDSSKPSRANVVIKPLIDLPMTGHTELSQANDPFPVTLDTVNAPKIVLNRDASGGLTLSQHEYSVLTNELHSIR